MQISAALPFPKFHSGKSFLKNITRFTFWQFVPTSYVRLECVSQKVKTAEVFLKLGN